MTSEELVALNGGRWVSERLYSEFTGLKPQSLCNMRYRDRKAGRDHSLPGYPLYRRFGRSVRYWLPAELKVISRSSR